jgi:ABC-type tungstate transport system permease subunit
LTQKTKWYLVDAADYTVDLVNHEFLSSIAAAGREESVQVSTTGRTSDTGVLDHADITFTAAAGDPCEYLICVKAAVADADADLADTAQRLIIFIDTATGLPVTLSGGNVVVAFDSGTNKIAKI